MRQMQFRLALCLLISLLCGFGFRSSAAQEKAKLTFTTHSEKARSFFEQGLAKYDRARSKEATGLFQQALEADPNFAMAHLFRGLAGDSVLTSGKRQRWRRR